MLSNLKKIIRGRSSYAKPESGDDDFEEVGGTESEVSDPAEPRPAVKAKKSKSKKSSKAKKKSSKIATKSPQSETEHVNSDNSADLPPLTPGDSFRRSVVRSDSTDKPPKITLRNESDDEEDSERNSFSDISNNDLQLEEDTDTETDDFDNFLRSDKTDSLAHEICSTQQSKCDSLDDVGVSLMNIPYSASSDEKDDKEIFAIQFCVPQINPLETNTGSCDKKKNDGLSVSQHQVRRLSQRMSFRGRRHSLSCAPSTSTENAPVTIDTEINKTELPSDRETNLSEHSSSSQERTVGYTGYSMSESDDKVAEMTTRPTLQREESCASNQSSFRRSRRHPMSGTCSTNSMNTDCDPAVPDNNERPTLQREESCASIRSSFRRSRRHSMTGGDVGYTGYSMNMTNTRPSLQREESCASIQSSCRRSRRNSLDNTGLSTSGHIRATQCVAETTSLRRSSGNNEGGPTRGVSSRGRRTPRRSSSGCLSMMQCSAAVAAASSSVIKKEPDSMLASSTHSSSSYTQSSLRRRQLPQRTASAPLQGYDPTASTNSANGSSEKLLDELADSASVSESSEESFGFD